MTFDPESSFTCASLIFIKCSMAKKTFGVNISQNRCEKFTFSLGYRLAKMAYLPGLIERWYSPANTLK
jgi:hypothetical protein